MTEAEWLVSTEVTAMVRFLRDQCSDRKFRLFALACCRRISAWITDPRSRAAVAFAERYAEVGLARRKGRPAVHEAARAACQEADAEVHRIRGGQAHAAHMIAVNAAHAALSTLEGTAWLAAEWAAGFSANATGWKLLAASHAVALPAWDAAAKRPEEGQQAAVLRDVVGNPFHPTALDPAWLLRNRGITAELARSIYEEQAFEKMPILADALEEAGCANAEILNHCRQPGVHVRGCWLLDALLGKGKRHDSGRVGQLP